MSQPVVIDNSVIMRWFHPSGDEKDLVYADKILKSLEENRIIPYAPYILIMEFVNVLHTLERKGELTGNVEVALMNFEHLGLEIAGPEYNAFLHMHSLSEFCSRYSLSAYDAAYLELAIRLDCPLLTLDKPLNKAAKKAGVTVEL